MITVVIQSNTTATVTRTPGVFARLFLGQQETTREVFDSGWHGWVYRHDDRSVEPAVEAAIERALTNRAVEQRFNDLVRR